MASSQFNIYDAPHYGVIGAGGSKTITPKGDGVGCFLLLIKRAALGVQALISYDYWKDTYDVISGTIPSSISITKSAVSGSITISNNTNSSVAYLLLE